MSGQERSKRERSACAPHQSVTASSLYCTSERSWLCRGSSFSASSSLLSQGPSTRPELARASGLSQPTVIAALNELVDARLVVPLGNDARDTGRPAKLYQVNPAAASVIAVDIGRVWVRVAVVDIAGDELYRHDVRNVARSATALVELISAEVSQAKAKLLLDPGRTYAVIGSPGVFAPKRGVVDYADQFCFRKVQKNIL